MARILVIRFGSLGDLCLLGWTLGRLADLPRQPGEPSPQVTVVTKAAFAPLVGRMRGVDQVVALEESGLAGLRRLAVRLRAEHWDTVIDAHNNLRSRLLLFLLGKRPQATLTKDTAARLWLLLSHRQPSRLNRTMADRFAHLWPDLLGQSSHPDLPMNPPLADIAAGNQGIRQGVGLAPGAQWPTKRWPENKFAELMKLWLDSCGEKLRIFLGPREQDWFPSGPLAQAAAQLQSVEVVQGKSLQEVARALADCRLLITNDSGLLHLAEAVGTPVLAFFGPTVQAFGYFPCLAASRVLEMDLACRPCSRNGKRPCHRGDLACLARIQPDQVLGSLLSLLAAMDNSPSDNDHSPRGA